MKTPAKQDQPKQLNIRLPDSLHREFKARCALDGLSLVEVIESLARLYVGGKVKLPKA
jgi:predicted HicB family RNase H-like nuclease